MHDRMYVPIPTMSALRVFNELLLIFVMCNKVTSIKSVVFKCFEANYYDFYRVFPQMMAPNFHQAAIDLEPYVRLAKLDTENEQQLAGQFNIRSIPTLAIFKDGREIARQSGALDLASLKRWIQPHLYKT
jgi:thiol-disulfide isomerase/thioredoxin